MPLENINYKKYNASYSRYPRFFSLGDPRYSHVEWLENQITSSDTIEFGADDNLGSYLFDLNEPEGSLTLREAVNHLFEYAVFSIFSNRDGWETVFAADTNDSDASAKAIAILKLNAFFQYADIYKSEDDFLKDVIELGNFHSPEFYYFYLYEFLSEFPKSSWGRLRSYGSNYIRLFIGEENLNRILSQERRTAFAANIAKLRKLHRKPSYAPIYKQFFLEFYHDENSVYRSPVSTEEFRERFVPLVSADKGSRAVFDSIFDACGWSK